MLPPAFAIAMPGTSSLDSVVLVRHTHVKARRDVYTHIHTRGTMMRTNPLEFLDTPALHVLAAVERAAYLARWIRQETVVPVSKPDRTPLTIADLAVQAAISSALERDFPEHALLAEEDGTILHTDAGQAMAAPLLHYLEPWIPGLTLASLTRLLNRGTRTPAERTWALDPIDGTKGFLRDGGHYVVALALLTANRPVLGVLACPTLEADGADGVEQAAAHHVPRGCLLVAGRAAGAWIRPLDGGEFAPLRVSAVATMRPARVLVSMAGAHIDADRTGAFMRIADIDQPPRGVDSQAKHALIAGGNAELFFRIPADPLYREQVWDQAAGALIVEEAGGRVTDLAGKALDFGAGTRLLHNEGVLVSNGVLHAPALLALRSARLRQR
jgi:3'(2'), 5'-bisphosphate nucleotidase